MSNMTTFRCQLCYKIIFKKALVLLWIMLHFLTKVCTEAEV